MVEIYKYYGKYTFYLKYISIVFNIFSMDKQYIARNPHEFLPEMGWWSEIMIEMVIMPENTGAHPEVQPDQLNVILNCDAATFVYRHDCCEEAEGAVHIEVPIAYEELVKGVSLLRGGEAWRHCNNGHGLQIQPLGNDRYGLGMYCPGQLCSDIENLTAHIKEADLERLAQLPHGKC
jgi:hypothetical protein